MGKLELGDWVVDLVTGTEGVAIAETVWLNGCNRVTVQPQLDKDGKAVPAESFDLQQLAVVVPGYYRRKQAEAIAPDQIAPPPAVAEPLAPRGGPRPEPRRAETPR